MRRRIIFFRLGAAIAAVWQSALPHEHLLLASAVGPTSPIICAEKRHRARRPKGRRHKQKGRKRSRHHKRRARKLTGLLPGLPPLGAVPNGAPAVADGQQMLLFLRENDKEKAAAAFHKGLMDFFKKDEAVQQERAETLEKKAKWDKLVNEVKGSFTKLKAGNSNPLTAADTKALENAFEEACKEMTDANLEEIKKVQAHLKLALEKKTRWDALIKDVKERFQKLKTGNSNPIDATGMADLERKFGEASREVTDAHSVEITNIQTQLKTAQDKKTRWDTLVTEVQRLFTALRTGNTNAISTTDMDELEQKFNNLLGKNTETNLEEMKQIQTRLKAARTAAAPVSPATTTTTTTGSNPLANGSSTSTSGNDFKTLLRQFVSSCSSRRSRRPLPHPWDPDDDLSPATCTGTSTGYLKVLGLTAHRSPGMPFYVFAERCTLCSTAAEITEVAKKWDVQSESVCGDIAEIKFRDLQKSVKLSEFIDEERSCLRSDLLPSAADMADAEKVINSAKDDLLQRDPDFPMTWAAMESKVKVERIKLSQNPNLKNILDAQGVGSHIFGRPLRKPSSGTPFDSDSEGWFILAAHAAKVPSSSPGGAVTVEEFPRAYYCRTAQDVVRLQVWLSAASALTCYSNYRAQGAEGMRRNTCGFAEMLPLEGTYPEGRREFAVFNWWTVWKEGIVVPKQTLVSNTLEGMAAVIGVAYAAFARQDGCLARLEWLFPLNQAMLDVAQTALQSVGWVSSGTSLSNLADDLPVTLQPSTSTSSPMVPPGGAPEVDPPRTPDVDPSRTPGGASDPPRTLNGPSDPPSEMDPLRPGLTRRNWLERSLGLIRGTGRSRRRRSAPPAVGAGASNPPRTPTGLIRGTGRSRRRHSAPPAVGARTPNGASEMDSSRTPGVAPEVDPSLTPEVDPLRASEMAPEVDPPRTPDVDPSRTPGGASDPPRTLNGPSDPPSEMDPLRPGLTRRNWLERSLGLIRGTGRSRRGRSAPPAVDDGAEQNGNGLTEVPSVSRPTGLSRARG